MLDYLWSVWRATNWDFASNPARQIADTHPRGWGVVLGAVIVGHFLLIGQSVILFANRCARVASPQPAHQRLVVGYGLAHVVRGGLDHRRAPVRRAACLC